MGVMVVIDLDLLSTIGTDVVVKMQAMVIDMYGSLKEAGRISYHLRYTNGEYKRR
jgi:hypothetical protein